MSSIYRPYEVRHLGDRYFFYFVYAEQNRLGFFANRVVVPLMDRLRQKDPQTQPSDNDKERHKTTRKKKHTMLTYKKKRPPPKRERE
jgi:hypothetical protein